MAYLFSFPMVLWAGILLAVLKSNLGGRFAKVIIPVIVCAALTRLDVSNILFNANYVRYPELPQGEGKVELVLDGTAVHHANLCWKVAPPCGSVSAGLGRYWVKRDRKGRIDSINFKWNGSAVR